jgi:hypothetical protein
MNHDEVMQVLKDPLAKELMSSSIPGRLGYNGSDGHPRVIPIGYLWDGEQIFMATAPIAPKVRALRKDPHVALSVDTNDQPPHVLLIRGTVSIEVVPGVAWQFLEASRKAIAPEQWQSFEANVRDMYKEMAVITLTPEWAKLMDFETRIPDFIGKLAAGLQPH